MKELFTKGDIVRCVSDNKYFISYYPLMINKLFRVLDNDRNVPLDIITIEPIDPTFDLIGFYHATNWNKDHFEFVE